MTDLAHEPRQRDVPDGLVGRVFSERYRLEVAIGRGMTSRVYRATDLALRRRVAVKVLRRDLAADDEAARRFEREARTCSLLRHPNTVRILDFGVAEEGWPYAVMELLDGRLLAAVLAERGPLPAAQTVAIAVQTCRSLEEAHAFGVHHGDLGPGTVFLTWPHGETACVKVIDFGGAGLTDGDGVSADLHALGWLLVEMLTGARGGRSPGGGRPLPSPPPPLPAEAGGRPIPAALRLLVAELLAPDPRERPAAAGDVAERLLAVDPRRSVATPAATLLYGVAPDPLAAALLVAPSLPAHPLEPLLRAELGARRRSLRRPGAGAAASSPAAARVLRRTALALLAAIAIGTLAALSLG